MIDNLHGYILDCLMRGVKHVEASPLRRCQLTWRNKSNEIDFREIDANCIACQCPCGGLVLKAEL